MLERAALRMDDLIYEVDAVQVVRCKDCIRRYDITTDGKTGEVVVHEVGAQIPGQYDMAGEQEPQPKILQFVK